MKKILEYFSDNKAQSTTEYGLFVLVLITACYGAIKIITAAWTAKFKFISLMTGILNAFF